MWTWNFTTLEQADRIMFSLGRASEIHLLFKKLSSKWKIKKKYLIENENFHWWKSISFCVSDIILGEGDLAGLAPADI